MKRSDRRKRLSDIADVAASLHAAPIEAPDFTASILDRVDAERAFLAPSVRKKIHVGRWAIGASVALVVLGIALTVRMAPSVVNVAGAPTPITTVVRTLESNADAHLDGLRKTIRTVSRTEPSEVISTFTAFAAASKAVEFESPAESPSSMLTLRAPVFTGPVLPVSTAMAMEPLRPATPSLPLIQARWQVRPQTSDLSAMMIRERQNARAALDSVSPGGPALFEHESEGLPVIR